MSEEIKKKRKWEKITRRVRERSKNQRKWALDVMLYGYKFFSHRMKNVAHIYFDGVMACELSSSIICVNRKLLSNGWCVSVSAHFWHTHNGRACYSIYITHLDAIELNTIEPNWTRRTLIWTESQSDLNSMMKSARSHIKRQTTKDPQTNGTTLLKWHTRWRFECFGSGDAASMLWLMPDAHASKPFFSSGKFVTA